MRTFDLIGLALKNLKGRWTALPVAGFAIGAFCLCFAGAIFTTVQQEKTQPFELAVSAQGSAGLTDGALAKLSQIPGVTAATPLLNVPVTVKTGNFTAELALTGIDGAYLGAFEQGQLFPKESAMPYLVLNEAACRQFSDSKENGDMDSDAEGDESEKPLPAIDWLNAGLTVQMGEGARPVVSKVCGILVGSGKDQEPSAYVSLSVAKELLRAGGQSVSPTTAKVRVKDIGTANGVSDAVAALGLAIGDTNAELQTKWDAKMEEMGYLIATGAFGLLCSLVLLSAWRTITLLKQSASWSMLRWMGMRHRDIDRIFLLQTVMISLIGSIVGTIIALCLPSFLPQETISASVFSLSIPAEIVIGSIIICTAVGLLPALRISNHNNAPNEVQRYALVD